jgi:hypothetical protein
MKNEINRDFYCSTAGMEDCPEKRNCSGCPDFHRKWPTPEQFKEEYGEEWEGAVYFRNKGGIKSWSCDLLADLSDRLYPTIDEAVAHREIVCACTPFGKPGNDWRPE